jgi:hypothetical protein
MGLPFPVLVTIIGSLVIMLIGIAVGRWIERQFNNAELREGHRTWQELTNQHAWLIANDKATSTFEQPTTFYDSDADTIAFMERQRLEVQEYLKRRRDA